MKQCSKCKATLPHSSFHKSSTSQSGLAGYCKACIALYGKSRYDRKIPERTDVGRTCRTCQVFQPLTSFANGQAKCRICITAARYSLTRAQYEALGNACYVCSSSQNLCVDHDHSCCAGAKSCGKCIRGLLCRKCNTAIGLLDDDPNRVQSLLNYLVNDQC